MTDTTGKMRERGSTTAMRNLLAKEIWRYNECPWDFDNPPEGMAQLQKQIAVDQAEGLLKVIMNSPLFRAALSTTQANNPVQGAEPSMRVEGRTAGANPATGATTQADLSNHAEYTPVALGAGTSQPPSVMAGAEAAKLADKIEGCSVDIYRFDHGACAIERWVLSNNEVNLLLATLRSHPAMGLSEGESKQIDYARDTYKILRRAGHRNYEAIADDVDGLLAIIDRLTGRSER